MMKMNQMKSCALVGPGAIGLYYGGLLAKAGVALHVLARSDTAALCADGIHIRMVDPRSGELSEAHAIRPAGIEQDAAAIGPVDLVIIAAKATVNPELLSSLQALVEPGRTTLLTLQNGMGNAEFLGKHFPENPVLAGLCFVCVNRTAPGVVENYLPGRVEIGSLDERFPEVAAAAVSAFSEAGVKCQLSPVLDAALWRKLCWNVPFNGLAIAGGGITTDLILADAALVQRAWCLMEEIQAAAALCGHEIADSFLQGQFDVTANMGAYRPSSLIDFLDGRAVEVEAIFGEPLRRGQALGLAMPELAQLTAQLVAAVARR
jgi:2-dehydropantoate 2-reductase